jgi:hypothetical protein
VLHAAQLTGNPQRIGEAQAELEAAERDHGEKLDLYEEVRRLVGRELHDWTAANRARVAESLEDEDLVAKAASSLGIGPARRAGPGHL